MSAAQSRKWKEPNHWFIMKNDRRPPLERAWYDPALESQGPDKAPMETTAHVSRRYFQLMSRHALMITFLQRIGKIETDRYLEWTSRAQMDSRHILFDCSAWTDKRRKMREGCKKE